MASNPQWLPNAPIVPYAVIIDPNGNVQQASSQGGTTSATPPTWNITFAGKTSDNTVTWTLIAQPTQVSLSLQAVIPTSVLPLPPPVFVADNDGLDPNKILTDMIANFQTAAQRVLQPAQVERLLINLYAYRESLVRNLIQYTGQQNLLAYATFPMLDFLGQLLGVKRLQSQGATATIQFTLTAALTVPLTIPQGSLVGTNDGAYQFATNSSLTIPAGQTTGVVSATATTPGVGANGYAVGNINVQLSPNSLVSAVSNTTVSSGGAAPETDSHLRTRIQAAPNQFSVAGPTGAYRFFALGVDPTIVDVQVISPSPGQVSVYLLIGPVLTQPAVSPNTTGIAGTTLLANALTALSANSVRPLTDTVTVFPVTEVDYAITGTIYLYSDADPVGTPINVNAAAVAFALALASRIQRDIVPEELQAALGVISGVYRVVLTSPTYTQLTTGQWANCTSLSLTYVVSAEHS